MSVITLAHGGGGSLQNELIRQEIVTRFSSPLLASLPDGAVTPEGLVISSDSFVITPRFFPGGNIGKLAVAGTVNDVLMAGGIPQYLTCSLIIEEGLELDELRKILDSMAEMAAACKVSIVTGDTKVVPRGSGDGLYINTAGVGFKRTGLTLGVERFAPGDKIIVSGSIGEHGLSVLASRFGMDCENLSSDCACLDKVVDVLVGNTDNGSGIKFMRDATRGGVLGITAEIFEKSACGATLYEDKLPVTATAAAVAKLLGIDPGFAACEGRLVAVVSSEYAEKCVKMLAENVADARSAAVIGEVTAQPGSVKMCGAWGTLRKLVVPAGDQLPRIC
ncbi:MAG: hydrogenase expression/formation protein HypE [Lentisphaerae bacterium]|nr:hydrogenase expression/formation protein HypE [Lentisphaerota bacterium]